MVRIKFIQRRIFLYILSQEVDFSPKTNGQDNFVSQNVSMGLHNKIFAFCRGIEFCEDTYKAHRSVLSTSRLVCWCH